MNIKNSKETILNQALAIFGKLGFHKTTMADIADASKRGRRTIYTYFKNKEEVYEAVVGREIDKILLNLKAGLEGTDPIDEKFSKYIEYRIHAIIALTKDYDALKVAFINNYRWVEKIREKLDFEEKKILTQLLQNASDQKYFAIENIETSVKNITLLIKGVEFMLVIDDGDESTTIQIKNLQYLLLNGLKTRKQDSLCLSIQ
jgi:AcrR family transcriptional regulator